MFLNGTGSNLAQSFDTQSKLKRSCTCLIELCNNNNREANNEGTSTSYGSLEILLFWCSVEILKEARCAVLYSGVLVKNKSNLLNYMFSYYKNTVIAAF